MEPIYKCNDCGKTFDGPRHLGNHLNYCKGTTSSHKSTSKTKCAKKKTIKKRPSHASINFVHSLTKHRTIMKKDAAKKQDRAVTYEATCLWKHPTLEEKASEILRSIRKEEEEQRRHEKEQQQEPQQQQQKQQDDHMQMDMAPDTAGTKTTGLEPEDYTEYNNNDIYELEEDNRSSYEGESSDEEEEEEGEDDDDEDEEGWEDIPEDGCNHQSTEPENKWTAFVYGDSGIDWKEPFRFKDNLPPYYMAQVSLMYILSQHKTNDLNIFDRIMQWVGHWTDKYPTIWKKRKRFSHHTRKGTLKFLAKMFDMKNTFPTPVTVELSNGKKATVPIMSFKDSLLSILNDADIMKDENMIHDNFDKNTLRPTKHYNDYGPDDIIDDLNSGYLYHKGIELYCNAPPPPGVDMIVPCPLVMYCDEASTDKHGALTAEPVSWTPGFLNAEARLKYSNWRHAGYIPNLKVGKGTNSDNFDDEYHSAKPGKKKQKRQ